MGWEIINLKTYFKMADNLENIGNVKLPSLINNPFSKRKIIGIYVQFRQNSYNKETWRATGQIAFQNGATSANQEFDGVSFDDVVSKIKATIGEL